MLLTLFFFFIDALPFCHCLRDDAFTLDVFFAMPPRYFRHDDALQRASMRHATMPPLPCPMLTTAAATP